jgi:hypothetical protein
VPPDKLVADVAPEIAVLVTPVTKPLALTVNIGICVAEPKVPTFELTVANVNGSEPVATVPVASPVAERLKAIPIVFGPGVYVIATPSDPVMLVFK